MLQRALLLQAGRLQICSRRGMAAVKGWKRPTMDELTVPTESWEHVNRKNQAKYNMYLLAGIGIFAATLVSAKMSGLFFFNTTPYHLLDKKKS